MQCLLLFLFSCIFLFYFFLTYFFLLKKIPQKPFGRTEDGVFVYLWGQVSMVWSKVLKVCVGVEGCG